MPGEDKDTIFLQFGRHTNSYTWATLIGALEARGIFERHAIDVVTEPGSMTQACIQSRGGAARNNFFLFSVNSYHLQKILKSIQTVRNFRAENGLEGRLHIIAGGPHANIHPEEILDAGADYVFCKEGEMALVEFFNAFYVYRSSESPTRTGFIPENVPNCYYRHPVSQKITCTRDADLVNLDDYPPIALNHRMFRPIEITRGCPHGCHFCLTPRIFGYAPRHRSVDNIACWIERAVKVKYKRVWFMAPNSFAYGSKGSKPNPTAIEALLKRVRGINGLDEVYFGTFPSEVRPEFVTEAVMDAVIPHVTNNTFVVGAQSASPTMLKSSHRGHSVEDVWNAVDIITGRGCKVDIDMIFGLPGETPDDEALTIEFMKRVLARPGVRIHGHVFMPLPGTVFEHEAPGIMSPEILKIIGQYTKAGRVFGQHFLQVRRAIKLSKNGRIS